MAMERVGLDFLSIEKTLRDIESEYKNVEYTVIRKAIRNGGLGKYGRTYRLSTQEVCFWINEHLKERKQKSLGI